MATMKAKMSKVHFIFNALIGEGGFGLVLSGMYMRNKEWYAVKEINKYNLLQHKTGLDMIFGELCALQKLRHPFIVRLNAAFHDAYVRLFFLFSCFPSSSFTHPLLLLFCAHPGPPCTSSSTSRPAATSATTYARRSFFPSGTWRFTWHASAPPSRTSTR
jgi:serine/threonine protein kinase